jgi:diguanylate cyclase (GGDEF)-like protein
MGNNGVKACPPVGSDLQHALACLERKLFAKLTVPLVKETENQVEEHLRLWGASSAEYFQAKSNEVKELLLVLAQTAEAMGERDHRYTAHFGELTAKLRSIADLDDLTEVRASLVKQAAEIKTYVDKMAQDSRESVAKLKAEVTTYETRLKAVEQLAAQDALTGIANRRSIEERIEWRIGHQDTFCILILDLNKFKEVNDTHGHLAGDHLLQQFSQELRTNVRVSDLVGRWGGDEFIVVLDGDLDVARSQVERLQKWALGEYTLQPSKDAPPIKCTVDASIGLAQWQPGESIKDLIARADSAMYTIKQQARGKHA